MIKNAAGKVESGLQPKTSLTVGKMFFCGYFAGLPGQREFPEFSVWRTIKTSD
jgi:hypothetical protein